MSGKTSTAEEQRDVLVEARPVSRMSLAQRGRIVRALERLSGDYELARVDGKYRVTRHGKVLESLEVYRCEDGVHLFLGGAPYI